MKKVILILCVVALLVSAATAAMASTTQWSVKFKAGGYNGTASIDESVVALAGVPAFTQTVSGDPINASANLASASGGSFYSTDKQVSGLQSYTFQVVLATGSIYADSNGQVYISAWSPDKSGTTSNTTGRAIPTNWTVRIQGTGVDYTWTQAQLLKSTDVASGVIGPVGFWFTPSGRSDAWVPTAGHSVDMFTVTVGSAPEPSSVLALGSGLFGLAGFAIRRRRA